MPVTRRDLGVGAAIAGISAVVALLTAVVTLYSQISQVIETSVIDRFRRDFAPIGTVVSSVLTPEDFASAIGESVGWQINRRTWVLADGRAVEGTKYAIDTKGKSVPDLRGIFLRGIDPSSGRVAGSIEDSATALPRSSPFSGVTDAGGEHTHPLGAARSTVDRYNAGGTNYWTISARDTGPAGSHFHNVSISAGGDPETRPKNVGIYYYIKIN
ncbi:hypothetical protein PMI07_002072 [Rhizobium sp. CF080]|uniref:hypothetical protein n=1 Tax=Rhizobium sp. (strain CF080) TaxID=1144310 RepID=UPI0002719B0D|nr:hypothetical protein [Rhizobium sp. CF080]EUB95584.1 hypothetical protein PMI07_002072 [Rhizobium sp. CF080]